MVGWSRRLYSRLAEITTFCSWTYSKKGDTERAQDFIFLFLVLIKRVRRRVITRSPCVTSGVDRFSSGVITSFKNHWKYRSCALRVRCGDVVRPWVLGICNDRLIWGKILRIDNLKLERAMRNLNSSDQEILLAVIWLVLTRVETEEIYSSVCRVCIDGTNLNLWRNFFTLMGFQLLISLIKNSNGGGILLYVKEDVSLKKINADLQYTCEGFL